MLLTVVTLCGFAANSVLCRLALGSKSIDPVSFTTFRLLAGAVMLALIVVLPTWKRQINLGGNLVSGLCLLSYAVAFSLAYVSLPAGTGALILFSTVQFTMFRDGIVRGERLSALAWVGVGIALSGLIWLVSPGVHAPSMMGVVLMVVAGISWGTYSIRGRTAGDAAMNTAGNFIRAVSFCSMILLVSLFWMKLSFYGVTLALISGAVTSGPCYVAWYMVLPKLPSSIAAVVQLSVPAIAALGGVLFLGEMASIRLWLSTLLCLGGVATAIWASHNVKKGQTAN